MSYAQTTGDYHARADARADAEQDRTDALTREATALYGIKEVLEAISEGWSNELISGIKRGDKDAGAWLLEIIGTDLEVFCKQYIDQAADDAEHEAELTAAAGMTL